MKHLILITTAASYFVLPHAALATSLPDHVFISEVNWAGSALSSADEWLEMTNPTGTSVDLTDWSIEGAATSSGVLTLPDDAVIEAYSTYLIANYEKNDSTVDVDAENITTELALSNSGLGLVLRDGSGAQIDAVGDGGSPSAGFSGTGGLGYGSMIWSADGWISATESSGFDAEVLQFGTPGVLDTDIVTEENSATEEVEEQEIIDVVDEQMSETQNDGETTNAAASETTPAEAVDEAEQTDLPSTTTPTEEESVAITQEESIEPTEATETHSTAVTTPMPKSYEVGAILINEMVSDPEDGNEWVEILNVSKEAIDLEGWRLEEGSESDTEFSGALAADAFTTAEFASRLNNDGDMLTLYDPSGNVIDQMSYGDWTGAEVEAAQDPNALARDAQMVWQITTQPTRGITNIIVAPLQDWTSSAAPAASNPVVVMEEPHDNDSPTTLRIVEVMPNPTGSDETEYIVIENFGEASVDLQGWLVADTSKTFELAGILASGLLLTLPRSITGLVLNNTDETISLIAPHGEMIDILSYENSKENQAIRHENPDHTNSADDPTVEYQNVSSNQMATDTVVTLLSAVEEPHESQTPASSTQTVEGSVIAPPDLFSSQLFYIDGLQIYQYRGDFPELSVGDIVQVHGTLSTAYGEDRIKLVNADAVTIIGERAVDPNEHEITELNDDAVGTLVKVAGVVTNLLPDRFTLEQSAATVLVVFKEATGLETTSMSPGEVYEVTGVLTRYNDELRILPRGQDDIMLQTATPPTLTGSVAMKESRGVPWGIVLLTGTGAMLVTRAWWRRKQKILKPSFT